MWGKKPEQEVKEIGSRKVYKMGINYPSKSLALAMLSMSSDTAYFIMSLKFSKPKNNLK